MKIDVVYISKRPKFVIFKDKYQWIFCQRQRERGDWEDKSYHPNLSNLLDELAEAMFKRNTKMVKGLRDLDDSIEKTYKLILRVCTALEKRL